MKSKIVGINKDYIGSALVILLGIGVIAMGRTYQIGKLSHMGPGFFPVALGCILVLVGAAIAATARLPHEPSEEEALPPEWRGWFCIIASLIAFVVIGTYGGLVLATFAITFISALGDRSNSLLNALLLSLGVLAMCLLVFVWGLGIQFPLFAWGGS
jgi:putative tricarboxylic transport membrane protein